MARHPAVTDREIVDFLSRYCTGLEITTPRHGTDSWVPSGSRVDRSPSLRAWVARTIAREMATPARRSSPALSPAHRSAP
jgi:hypothetical protein